MIMLFDALDMYESYREAQTSAGDERIGRPIPEELAKDFAARWMAHMPDALRTGIERELASLIRRAVESGQGERASRAA